MTQNDLFFDPLDDLGWTWDAQHWIQNKICNRTICISCAFGHVSEFWPQNDLFWPLRWPLMNSRCTSLESEYNSESIDMHIMCIWPHFRFLTPRWPFLTPQVTSDDLGWPQDAHHWIQKKISYRSICISCIFDIKLMFLPFYPFNDSNPVVFLKFDPIWPNQTQIRNPEQISYNHIFC